MKACSVGNTGGGAEGRRRGWAAGTWRPTRTAHWPSTATAAACSVALLHPPPHFPLLCTSSPRKHPVSQTHYARNNAEGRRPREYKGFYVAAGVASVGFLPPPQPTLPPPPPPPSPGRGATPFDYSAVPGAPGTPSAGGWLHGDQRLTKRHEDTKETRQARECVYLRVSGGGQAAAGAAAAAAAGPAEWTGEPRRRRAHATCPAPHRPVRPRPRPHASSCLSLSSAPCSPR